MFGFVWHEFLIEGVTDFPSTRLKLVILTRCSLKGLKFDQILKFIFKHSLFITRISSIYIQIPSPAIFLSLPSLRRSNESVLAVPSESVQTSFCKQSRKIDGKIKKILRNGRSRGNVDRRRRRTFKPKRCSRFLHAELRQARLHSRTVCFPATEKVKSRILREKFFSLPLFSDISNTEALQSW